MLALLINVFAPDSFIMRVGRAFIPVRLPETDWVVVPKKVTGNDPNDVITGPAPTVTNRPLP